MFISFVKQCPCHELISVDSIGNVILNPQRASEDFYKSGNPNAPELKRHRPLEPSEAPTTEGEKSPGHERTTDNFRRICKRKNGGMFCQKSFDFQRR